MKAWTLMVMIIVFGCGGSLSDEQRKKMREGMAEHKIVKMTDAEIVSNSLAQGRKIFNALQASKYNRQKVDSLNKAYGVKIRWVVPGESSNAILEQQLIDAYVTGVATGAMQDNIQKLYTETAGQQYDSLLYSKPVTTQMPDGSEQLEGVWNIYLSKKSIVLAAEE